MIILPFRTELFIFIYKGDLSVKSNSYLITFQNVTPFNLSNADLYIIILLRRIIEYNKGNLSVIK
jgi:hypothetical protein